MDLFEIFATAVIIAGAVAFSDWLTREPKADGWVDRDSPWLDRFERPHKPTGA